MGKSSELSMCKALSVSERLLEKCKIASIMLERTWRTKWVRVMSFDSRGFLDRNSQYFNKPTLTHGSDGKAMGKAVFEDRNRSGIPRPRRFRHRASLSFAGRGGRGVGGETEGQSCACFR